jgi:adenine/guanine phosphoribosyltransferase-like PRPP-binding protein
VSASRRGALALRLALLARDALADEVSHLREENRRLNLELQDAEIQAERYQDMAEQAASDRPDIVLCLDRDGHAFAAQRSTQ